MDLFRETLDLVCSGRWVGDQSVDGLAKRLTGVMTDSCDLAAHRIGKRPPRRAAYWWNTGIEVVRAICTRCRRRLTRLRRRGPSPERDAAETEYRAAKRALKAAIKETKSKAWRELITTVNRDPWGLPFKLVLGRLRRASPRLTETLEEGALDRLLDSLFPRGETHNPTDFWGVWQGPMEEYTISGEETIAAIRRARRKGGNPASGPDGLTSEIWGKITKSMVERMTEVYNVCVAKGQYPWEWKRAFLVLIPKGGAEAPNRTGTVKARPMSA